MDSLAAELMALAGALPIQADPRDFTQRYNTQLTPKEELQFAAWLSEMKKKNGRDFSKDMYDYDIKGAWKAGANQAANGHFPDTFKKPNHPTFSVESKYSGIDGNFGGKWIEGKDGKWTFVVSPQQLKLWKPDELQKYFKDFEKDSSLVIQ